MKNPEIKKEEKPPDGYFTIEAHPKAVVVHCGDPRFQLAFQDFIQKKLNYKPGEYVLLVIPGGISALVEPETLPKNFKVAKEQIQFFLDHFDSIKTVVLINHEDCKAYESLKDKIGQAFMKFAATMIQRQQIDLAKVMKFLSASAFKVNFKAYFAKFKDDLHKEVVFEEVSLLKK